MSLDGLLIAAAILIGFIFLAFTIERSLKDMTDDVQAALERLTTDVSTVITDVAQALRDATTPTTDPATAAAIIAQAERLEAFDATLPKPASTQLGGAGDDTTTAGGAAGDTVEGGAGANTVAAGGGSDTVEGG